MDQLLAALITALWGLWKPLRIEDWFDDTTVAGVGAQSAALVRDTLIKQQRASRVYAQTMLRQVNAPVTRLQRPVFLYPRHGALMPDVYERPAREFRRRMKELRGDVRKSWDAAEQRAGTLAETDLRLVANRAERDTYADSPRVAGYRRVVHPELSKSGTCGLCLVAADRFYTVKELQPIHDHCRCTTAPIVKGNDPGLDLNRADLNRIYAAAGGNTRDVLKNVRVKTVEHGEIGPILTKDGQEIKLLGDFEEKTAEQQAKDDAAAAKLSTQWVAALERAIATGKPQQARIGARTYKVPPNPTALAHHKNFLANLARDAA